MKKTIQAIRRFLRCCIGDTIWVLRYYGKLKAELRKSSIINVKLFKFSRWHGGFNYFLGTKEGAPVFIKLCCGEWNTIPAEAFLQNYDLGECHPGVVAHQMKPFSWIATEYMKLTPIDELGPGIDAKRLVEQMANILIRLREKGVMHRDLRPENICVDQSGNLLLIDFGWAIYEKLGWRKTEYEFIEKILNRDYRNTKGEYDDALSAYLSFREAFPKLSEDDLIPIRDEIGSLTIS